MHANIVDAHITDLDNDIASMTHLINQLEAVSLRGVRIGNALDELYHQRDALEDQAQDTRVTVAAALKKLLDLERGIRRTEAELDFSQCTDIASRYFLLKDRLISDKSCLESIVTKIDAWNRESALSIDDSSVVDLCSKIGSALDAFAQHQRV